MTHIMIAGNLGADPDKRKTPSGQTVTTLRVAVNNRRGGQDETLWWRATLWGDSHDKMVSYLKKGSSVLIHGTMSKPEIYTDRSGNPQVSLNMTAYNVSFSPFGKGSSSDDTQQSNQGFGGGQPQSGTAASDPFADMSGNDFSQVSSQGSSSNPFSDDEIPF